MALEIKKALNRLDNRAIECKNRSDVVIVRCGAYRDRTGHLLTASQTL